MGLSRKFLEGRVNIPKKGKLWKMLAWKGAPGAPTFRRMTIDNVFQGVPVGETVDGKYFFLPPKIGRNEICPCGKTDKKYKHCCNKPFKTPYEMEASRA